MYVNPSKYRENSLFAYLAYAGALPFIISAGLLWCNIQTLGFLGDVVTIMISYGVVIVAFMAGSHWGLHLGLGKPWSFVLPLISNVVTIVVWFCYLLCPVNITLIVVMCIFILLCGMDFILYKYQQIGRFYFTVRLWVTCIVVTSFVISFFMII